MAAVVLPQHPGLGAVPFAGSPCCLVDQGSAVAAAAYSSCVAAAAQTTAWAVSSPAAQWLSRRSAAKAGKTHASGALGFLPGRSQPVGSYRSAAASSAPSGSFVGNGAATRLKSGKPQSAGIPAASAAVSGLGNEGSQF